VRRLALLLAGGALWIVFSAAPAFADGGPHTMDINNGTNGLAGDCAACHRAHQSTATDLLKSSQPGLCLSCHDGTGSTADVVDGVQFTPATWTGAPLTDPVLGALRGGGFSYAYIDTANPARLSYNSRGGETLTLSATPTAGSITLHWNAWSTFAGGNLVLQWNDTAATAQVTADALFSTSTTYSGSTSLAYMSGLPAGGSNIVVTKSGNVFTFTPHNGLRLDTMPLPTVSTNSLVATATPVGATIANGISIGQASQVGVRDTAQATTSTHLGAGTVWGNGAVNSGAGATGVTLECTNCHNPHGNGMYRILQTVPGEDWSSTAGVVGWTAASSDVEVIDGAALTTGQIHNYTVRPGYLATDVKLTATPDYFRYKWDPSGKANFTNFYLLKDPMNSGWNGQTPTNDAAIQSIPNTTLSGALTATATSIGVASTAGMPTHTPTTEPQPLFLVKIDSEIIQANVSATNTLKLSRGQYGTTAASHLSGATVQIVGTGASQDSADYALYNNTGRMTAFCIACHTRYNGWAQNGTSSLNAQTPMDTIFTYKHGTTSVGCEQCHVNHGTNAAMSGPAAGVTFPNGSAEDSALLKVNNRGTCQLCHDPTGTVPAGNEEGTVPASILNP
jgi:predicted CXXCH cytochrome family protein